MGYSISLLKNVVKTFPIMISTTVTFDGDGAAPAHGVDDDVAGLDVGHGEERTADRRPERRRAEVRDVPLEEAVLGQRQGEVNLDWR